MRSRGGGISSPKYSRVHETVERPWPVGSLRSATILRCQRDHLLFERHFHARRRPQSTIGDLASLGVGIINWVFALPAVYTIDTFGGRNLFPTTSPFMSFFLSFIGSSFYIPDSDGKARHTCVALGIYLFMVLYSPGEGPVPFTWWIVLLFVLEMKALTLEKLNQVFSVPTQKHSVYQLGQAKR